MKWISVKEELPDRPMPVIAYMADRRTVILTRYHEDFTLLRAGLDGFEEHGVTHWMPLPEPPEEE